MHNFLKLILRKDCLILFFIFLFQNAESQSPLRKDIIPHSPEAEILAKFVTTPVTLYSGTPAVTVPVYEIKSSKLSLPISLNYNYNGYRPGEDASCVGLGWALSAGGGITRVVKGLVDHVDDIPTVEGWYDDYVDIVPISNKQEFLTGAAIGLNDTEPDLYIFNFNGYSGKFNWINGKAVMYPHQDLRIEKTGSVEFEKFIITVQDGTIYTFDEREMTYHGHTAEGADWVPQHTSAWFLTTIQSSDKTDEIDFTYAAYNYTQPITFIDKYTIISATGSTGFNTGGHSYTSTQFAGSGILGKQLSQITSKAGMVTFETESVVREDLLNSTAKALKTIHVYDNTSLLKNISLVHNYFSGSSPSGFRKTKLNLKEVDISSFPTDANGEPLPEQIFSKYLFEYDSESANFAVQTKGIDYWGYYNGANINQSLFPNVNFITPVLPVVGNREPDFASCSIGILHKITYPTSGYSIFNYQQNSIAKNFSPTPPRNVHIGVPFNSSLGDPTTSQTSFTISMDQTINISFGRTITSQYPMGVLNNLYILQIYDSEGALVYTCHRLGKQETDASASVPLTAGDYYFKVTCENTSSYCYGNISYAVISNGPSNIPAGGVRVSSIKSYDNITQTSPALTKNYIYNDAEGNSKLVQLASPGLRLQEINHVSDIWTIEQNYTEDYNSSLSGLLDEQFYYSSVGEVNNSIVQSGKTQYDYQSYGPDVSGVFLKKQTEYIYNGQELLPIKITDNNYDIVNKTILTAYRSELSADGRLVSNPDYDDYRYRLNIYKVVGLYSLPSSYKLLNNTVVTTYDQYGQNPMLDQTNYFYNNPQFQFPTSKVEKNSKGEEVLTEFKYPLDYNFTSCSNPLTIDAAYNTEKQNTINTYNNCVITRYNALTNSQYGDLHPYASNSPQNQSEFTSILNANPCEDNFRLQSITAYANRNTAHNTYTTCLGTAYINSTIPGQKAIILMQKNHIISPVLEQYISIKKSGVDNLVSATKTDYKIKTTGTGYDVAVPDVIYKTELASPVLKSSFLSTPAVYYKPQAGFTFDNDINLTEQHKTNDLSTSYMWDYNSLYPIAELINAGVGDIFSHTSFETEGKGGFTFSGLPVLGSTSPTGRKYYLLNASNTISRTINPGVSYIISLWSTASGVTVNNSAATKTGRTVNGWTYREWKVSGQTSISISCSGSVSIDELRLYPVSARMSTVTYSPGRGITTKCDENNRITYYEYDPLGRLKLIRNQDNHIIKTFDYKYQQ